MSSSFRDSHLIAFLNLFDKERKPLDLAFSDYLRRHKSIGSHDRRFIGDTVYALMRWKGVLDYQLSPDPTWSDRYALWKTEKTSPSIPASIRCGASPWLFQELVSDYGEEKAICLSQILNTPAPLTVRVNTLKISRDELLQLWKNRYPTFPCPKSQTGIVFAERVPLTATDEFKKGFFEIQDEGSQLIAELVQPKAKEHVLDYCSGSGGKTLAIAAKMCGKGQIYLHDIRPHILLEAKKRLRRAGVQNAQFLQSDHPTMPRLINKMDWVLVDVPCSGSGTFRRNPDMKWRYDSATLSRLSVEQRAIFQKALEYVKPNGKIVYATCSLFQKENQKQVDYFLKSFPITLAQEPLAFHPVEGGLDGFFGAVFIKQANCYPALHSEGAL